MVQADRAGVPHGRGYQPAHRLEVAGGQRMRIEGGEAPVLTRRIEFVGRGADRNIGKHDVLIAPGIGAVRVDADGDIDIKSDRKTVPPRLVTAGLQLAVSDPLHELMEFTRIAMRAVKVVQGANFGMTPGVRPLRPRRRRVTLAQNFEAGKAQQRVALLLSERFEFGTALCARRDAKAIIGQTQGGELDAGHICIGNDVRGAQGAEFGLEPRRNDAGKFGKRFDIDIERVEKQPAIGRVGARLVGTIREQRMQRIEADAGRAAVRRNRHQPPEIAEIAVPPIAGRAYRIKLDGQRPIPPSVTLEGTQRLDGLCGQQRRPFPPPRQPGNQARDGLRIGGVPVAEYILVAGLHTPNFRGFRKIVHFRFFKLASIVPAAGT